MCHSAPLDSSFWIKLFHIDQQIAEQVRSAGCQRCESGGPLHVANYPRKPRSECRAVLGSSYDFRFSFCCAVCRQRTTPASVRFLGRKVYLGAIISLISAGADALDEQTRRTVIEVLNLPAQTLYRWRLWWSTDVPASTCWRSLSGWFSPPIPPARLPGALLARLSGSALDVRLVQLLQLLAPLTTCTGSHLKRVAANTHTM